MLKKIIVSGIFIGFFITATPALAITARGQATMSEVSEVKATPVSANAVAKISCVGMAVNIREQAIDTAVTKFATEFTAAYTARASALKNAYALTNTKDVKGAVKTAWSTFNSGIKTARKNWQASKNAAWAQFKTAGAACKAPAETSDNANISSEVSGS